MSNIESLLDSNTPYFLTDAGLETWLVFQRGVELREFASFELIHSESGKELLKEYFTEFLDLAERQEKGFILDTPTWRAGQDWCQKLGFDIHEMEEINVDATSIVQSIRAQRNSDYPIFINGVVGPRGDGYVVEELMEPEQAEIYHAGQIAALKRGGVDMISAITMTNVQEAMGIAKAAQRLDMPCVISFTVETDGSLPSGQKLGEAISQVDEASNNFPLYFMINCAHPDHFRDAIDNNEPWINRIGGIRANASRMSHAELDVAEELDEGNPTEFGILHGEIVKMLPGIRVLGGCCGSDQRHIEAICSSTIGNRAAAA